MGLGGERYFDIGRINCNYLDDIIEVHNQIEFKEPANCFTYDNMKLLQNPEDGLLLAAYISNHGFGKDRPVGFLASHCKGLYDKGIDLRIWIGGVIPEFRRQGIMKIMMDITEWWASESLYDTVSVKTFPKFKSMMVNLEGRGYEVKRKKGKNGCLGILYTKRLNKRRHKSWRKSGIPAPQYNIRVHVPWDISFGGSNQKYHWDKRRSVFIKYESPWTKTYLGTF